MKLSELEPWKALAGMLDGEVSIALSETTSTSLKAYGQGEMPNTGLAEAFILVANNGEIRNLTHPYGIFRGNIAITVFVKAQPNGRVNANRVNSIISQIESIVNDSVSGDGAYFYKFPADNIITPYSVNASNGYSMTMLNVEWRTTRM